MKKIFFFWMAVLAAAGCFSAGNPPSAVVREGGKTYIVDVPGEKWDVTQAEALGFSPEKFQYGIGRNAFTTLDDRRLTDKTAGVKPRLRVIGIADEGHAQAYSVSRLFDHEIANSMIGPKPVAVGY